MVIILLCFFALLFIHTCTKANFCSLFSFPLVLCIQNMNALKRIYWGIFYASHYFALELHPLVYYWDVESVHKKKYFKKIIQKRNACHYHRYANFCFYLTITCKLAAVFNFVCIQTLFNIFFSVPRIIIIIGYIIDFDLLIPGHPCQIFVLKG